MSNHRVYLETPVPEPIAGAVLDKLAHANEHLRAFVFDDKRTSISITVDDAERVTEVEAAVRSVVRAMVRGYRDVASDVVWRNATPARHAAPIWDAMVSRGLVRAEAPGCVALLGDACRVALALDAALAAIARDVFAAEPHQYPTLIPNATLERCDYFASFAHHMTFAPHVLEDLRAIEGIAASEPSGRAEAVRSALSEPQFALSPSVCFHTYAALRDSTLPERRTVTAVNRCYRWEGANFATCERLWDFTMREIVFVGEPAWVDTQRQRAIDEIATLTTELDLDATIETASDPFFVGQYAAKRYFQLVRRAKYELRLSLPYARSSLSAASFNIHDDFFGRAFAIHDGDGEPMSTGCFGAGIERWVWALFAQHGPSLSLWPQSARARLGV